MASATDFKAGSLRATNLAGKEATLNITIWTGMWNRLKRDGKKDRNLFLFLPWFENTKFLAADIATIQGGEDFELDDQGVYVAALTLTTRTALWNLLWKNGYELYEGGQVKAVKTPTK